jgi:choline dehydrogenase
MKIQFITFALVVTATVSLFADQCSLEKPHQQNLQKDGISKPLNEKILEADIIVVGGGAAGCILMNKLSEKGQFSVLGIEAGKNLTKDPAIEQVGLPAFLLPATGRFKYFWQGWTQTQPMPGLNGRTSDWTTGMLLGGGSSINGLYYGRGSNAVYSRWEKISGSKNWSLKKILKTFKDLEHYEGLTTTKGARGHKGSVNILQTPTVSELTTNILLPATNAVFQAAVPGGLPPAVDYNDPSVENCIDPRAQWLINSSGTKRVSSATAFLNSKVMTKDGHGVNGHKLHVLFDSVVTKIVFNKHGVAKKVQFMKDGKLMEARAKKAVVLAGGFNSSKILQLSGIGPKETLKKAGIKPVFINENVGKHLQNHPTIFIPMLANPADIGIPAGAPYAFTILNVYLPVVGSTASDPRMLQILFEYIPNVLQSPDSAFFDFLPADVQQADVQETQAAAAPQAPVPLLVIGFDLLNPKSEGSVNIQSNNPFQIAAVDDGFYQDPVDLKNMMNAIKSYIGPLVLKLATVEPLLSPYYKPFLTDPIIPVIASGFSDQALETYVKNNSNLALDIHHFVSHCKMAPLKDGGVVDGNLLVHGTKNVFVVDNSVCPSIPDINTTGAAMMIGLHGSKILKRVLPNEKEVP